MKHYVAYINSCKMLCRTTIVCFIRVYCHSLLYENNLESAVSDNWMIAEIYERIKVSVINLKLNILFNLK